MVFNGSEFIFNVFFIFVGLQDIVFLVFVFVCYWGYIVLVEVVGFVQEGEENVFIDVDVDDLFDGGVNVLNVNR